MKPIHRDLKFSPDHETVSEEPAEITSSKKVEVSRKGSETLKHKSAIVRKGSNASLNDSFMDQPKVVSTKSSVSDSSEGRSGIVRKGSNASLNGSFLDQPKVVSTKSSVSDSSEGRRGKSQRNDGAKDVKFVVTSKSSTFVDASQGKLVRSRSTSSVIKDTKTSVASKPPWKNVLARSISLNVSKPSSHGHNHVGRKKKYAKEENNSDGAADDEAEEKVEAECNKEDKGEGLFKTTKKNGKDIVKGNLGMTHKKGIAVMLKDKDSSLTKMKFQRGRTVELQSANSGPRKLKFRRAKVLLVNQDGKADVTKNFRKAVINKARVIPKARKVVLRHRSVEGKKDAQGLFNNVIEETASKLVQSRKSKVKALVGAFETVISLQDTNPSSSVVTEGDTLPNS
ncbi:hypothetical protein Leryth_022893 [Lithospermum erythrorhizon]|nr:hypothetical protein Leryth_022893 [Lithospermum erythrorhizon]